MSGRASIVGAALLFAGCATEPPADLVEEGAPCEEENAVSCGTAWPEDQQGYFCIEGVWTADVACNCVESDEPDCSVIGFTGVSRAGPRPGPGRRLRRT